MAARKKERGKNSMETERIVEHSTWTNDPCTPLSIWTPNCLHYSSSGENPLQEKGRSRQLQSQIFAPAKPLEPAAVNACFACLTHPSSPCSAALRSVLLQWMVLTVRSQLISAEEIRASLSFPPLPPPHPHPPCSRPSPAVHLSQGLDRRDGRSHRTDESAQEVLPASISCSYDRLSSCCRGMTENIVLLDASCF